MLSQSLRGLAIAVVAALTLAPAPAAAVTPVTACRDLDKAGETYIVTADITENIVPGTACFTVLADRITLDLGGHTITGPGVDGGFGVFDDGARISTVVKNGSITGFGIGIFLFSSTRNTVRNVTASDNGAGMLIGPSSLVKDCIAQGNIREGIATLFGVQVQGCLIGGEEPGNGNGFVGLFGGERALLTGNTVIGNGATGLIAGPNSTVTHNTSNNNGGDVCAGVCRGIDVRAGSLVSQNTANGNATGGIKVDERSTVTFNTASNNGDDGIVVGGGSLVTGNTANDNGQDGITVGERSTVTFNTANDNDDNGIEVVCPSTILHNVVVGNGALAIRLIGQGCFLRPNRIPE